MSNFGAIKDQALKEVDLLRDLSGKTYIDKLIEECPAVENTMTVQETINTYNEWCWEQGIRPGDFMMKLYCILEKSYSKINCFMLQGASNAGKTFWTTGLLPFPFPDVTGQTVQSQDFAYQTCLNKEIIQIPELSLTKPETVEERKKIFEGLPTTVNVKNKEPRLLQRTPVILTCNKVPWTFCNEEAPMFRNRMFSFENLHPSKVLINKKAPNPIFFQKVFHHIKTAVATSPEFPCMPSDIYWSLYQEQVEDFMNCLEQEERLTMGDYLDHPQTIRYSLPIPTPPPMNRMNYLAHSRLTCNIQDFLKHLMTWFRLLAQNNSEDYFWDFSRKDPKLMSSFTGGEYWIQEDLDLGDLNSFRSAFVHCRRLLMRIPNWAVTYSEDMLFEDRMKMMVKYNLIKMAEILREAIKQGKDLNRILHAE